MKTPKPRGLWIAGNWKMNHLQHDTVSFFEQVQKTAESSLSKPAWDQLRKGAIKPFIFPSTLSLKQAQIKAKALAPIQGFQFEVGAQNAHGELAGAFTGEVSAPMLLELGVHWTLIGHSERRQLFGETNETVRKRLEGLLPQGIQVILCIGETHQEREQNKTEEILLHQIQTAITQKAGGAAPYLQNGKLILAYEPVWAIGTGLTASPEQAEEAHSYIRKLIDKNFGKAAALATPILYGGSVNLNNISELLSCSHVDGALVGGASLKAQGFLQLLDLAGKVL